MRAMILMMYKRVGTRAILALVIPLLRVLAERSDNVIDDEIVSVVSQAYLDKD